MSPLLKLPAELLLRIIYHIPSVRDKIQLLQTCRHLNHLLCTHVACWDQLDLSAYSEITNSALLLFLKNTNIYLYNTSNCSSSEMNRVSQLDLSGCWCLSQDMVVALSKSFPCLDTLCLNGYRLVEEEGKNEKKNDMGFEQRRVHVYQVRPAHDLSSMAMDLSKKATHRLNIPYILLSNILIQVPHITSLSIQYQDLSPAMTTHRPYFSEFIHIQHLDISSCTINQSSLQSMLRRIGRGLKSLKMLNIDLNNMTWLCLSQYGKSIECLHISCNEPTHLTCIRHTVSNLKYLNDFRLTRIRSGTIDLVIEKLNASILKRLDLSPKMNIYPKASQPTQKTKSRKHPPQTNTALSMSNYATTEHDLLISTISLHRMIQCHELIELRLCFPTLSASWCYQLLKSLPQLEIFELRIKNTNSKEHGVDYLNGIGNLSRLKQLYLYSVYITEDAIGALVSSNCRITLRHITVTQGGEFIEKEESQQLIMNRCELLESFYLGLSSSQQSFYKKDGAWCV